MKNSKKKGYVYVSRTQILNKLEREYKKACKKVNQAYGKEEKMPWFIGERVCDSMRIYDFKPGAGVKDVLQQFEMRIPNLIKNTRHTPKYFSIYIDIV